MVCLALKSAINSEETLKSTTYDQKNIWLISLAYFQFLSTSWDPVKMSHHWLEEWVDTNLGFGANYELTLSSKSNIVIIEINVCLFSSNSKI